MPISGSPDNLYFGRANYPSKIYNVAQVLGDARDEHFDFVTLPLGISTQEGEYEFEPSVESDLALDCSTWSSAVLGEVSTWIDPDGNNGERSLVALQREIEWCGHLSTLGILVQQPNPKSCSRYAGHINRLIQNQCVNIPLVLKIPMKYPEGQEGWNTWNTFRLMCESSLQLQVALELTAQISDVPDRWHAEPIRYMIVPCKIFLRNKQGYPVLPKAQQNFLLEMFCKYKCQVIIETDETIKDDTTQEDDSEREEVVDQCSSVSNYIDYIARLFNNREKIDASEYFGLQYRDYLQAPLQPLSDNLESQTYETFEKDPVKYVQYEEAVVECITDKLKDRKSDDPLIIMVVGAGRGPLVEASLNAAARTGLKKFEVWAVEKNPNAVITLRHKKRDELHWDPVTIIHQDMREWQAPKKADIMVSELLGSFGDNELSPECLDGAQRFLAPDGVSIPQSYYSTIRCISTPKLWTELKKQDDLSKLETSYVVKLHQFWSLTDEAKIFSFEHPNWDLKPNTRYTRGKFTAHADALCHGFSAYFHCDLYKNVTISIEPKTESKGMFSWFPAYFPLRTPINFRKGEEIIVDFWRCEDKHMVWYEWAVPSHNTPIHNPNGRSYFISK